MKISYNWLKQYISIDTDPQKLSEALTGCGLEVEALEEYSSIKGGLKGCFIGEVKTNEKHPDADKLTITTVDIGRDELLHIVCGAPNVEAGQKVVVATTGTTLYTAKGELELKKTKIRGQVSEGMICAEDELGLGTSHDGIMVLEASAKIGMTAAEYFKIENDWIFEIGLTPNRADAMSHIGVARDVAAALNVIDGENYSCRLPDVNNFKTDNTNLKIDVIVDDVIACPRYAGITLSGITVNESPAWLQNRLKSIGLRPINNIVDITNFVQHETGEPLHAFDTGHITGKKVIVKKLPEGTKFITLDETERTLASNDLMICNDKEGMCIAGVFGGIKSGVTEKTKNVFIESAYFDPVHVRKTSKHHGLKTDASFRFERGVDPNIVIFALKRAALLMKEIAGGKISSEIVDVYPKPIENFKVSIKFANVDKLIGKKIDRKTIEKILVSLGISVISENSEGMELSVPPFKVDVQREADVIEEILRIYGFNNIKEPDSFHISPSKAPYPDKDKLQNKVSDYLSSNGFYEILNNSLTNEKYIDGLKSFQPENNVVIMNALSNELGVMRQSMLFGGLESILYNHNRKNFDLKFYEFGKIYKYKPETKYEGLNRYEEKEQLAIFITGNTEHGNWNTGKGKPSDFFYLKSFINNILMLFGIKENELSIKEMANELIAEGLEYTLNKTTVATFGKLNKNILKKFDLRQDVFYAEMEWKQIVSLSKLNIVSFSDVSKFPEVRRDLALIIDDKIKFSQIKELAFKTVPALLKEINLFDIYSDEKIGNDKKSYAVSFIIQDKEKTLTDAETDSIINKLISVFSEKLNAKLRQ
ncbi:MAG: phenylalanine--tRNA ligase subunit beta [Bacteroidota bacterium]